MAVEVKAIPAGGEAMFIVFNKHALRSIKDGKQVSLDLLTGDRKICFKFMRDTAFAERKRKGQQQNKEND